MCCFCVSILPLVQGKCAVRGHKVMPNSFVQLMKSVLMKAVPRSSTIDWGILKECIHLSTGDIVACVRNWVFHQETTKCINNQEAMEIPVTWWVKRSFVINMDCSERNCLDLPFFQWYFNPVFRLWFIVLAGEAISSECIYPVKHARTVVESFCITVSFWSAHVSTHFVVMAKFRTG